jgi:predicted MPP superfamily phosphohydrolase
MPLIQIVLCLLALFGHLAFWVGAFSRVHGLGLRRWQLEILEKLILVALVGVPAGLVGWFLARGSSAVSPVDVLQEDPICRVYFWLCAAAGVYAIFAWTRRTCRGKPAQFVAYEMRTVDMERQIGRLPCGDTATRLLARLPGNQILRLEVNVKELVLPRLPLALDGLTIAHVSDLHFTGHLTREFFDVVVAQTNAMDADLVAITGDIIDRRACLSWIDGTLGGLHSRLGTFYVFGNHDRRIRDRSLLVRQCEQAGLQYLGGRWAEVRPRGHSLLLAGNELPWLRPAADLSDCPNVSANPRPVRVLLSHGPDQIQWARAGDFDLMLAGHTHGGQIRLPVFGAIVGQSVYGLKYCSGVFYVEPTLLHVSRGVSGVENLRINCRPELTKLVLRSGAAARDGTLPNTNSGGSP